MGGGGGVETWEGTEDEKCYFREACNACTMNGFIERERKKYLFIDTN